MASKSHTLKVPHDLYEALGMRAGALGYRTASAYLKGLVRYDLLVQGRHDITLPMSHLPDSEQDKIDGQLLAVTKRGVGERGQLLKRLLERVKASGDAVEGASVPGAITAKAKAS